MQLGALVLLATAAAPLGRAPLRLQFDGCSDIDRATVSQVVITELEAALAEERPEGAVTTANAQCSDARVRLTIDDPVTGKSTTRTVDLEGQPRGLRSRLLGLAISEAVLASWIELQLTSELPSSAAAETSPEARREAANIAERRLQVAPARSSAPRGFVAGPELSAGPLVRWFSAGLLTLGLSGGARRWFDSHPLAGVGLELDGSYGEHSVPDVARANATSLSLAPSLLMRGAFGDIMIMAGAGWRIGLARLSAEPASTRPGRAAWSVWTGPFLSVDLGVALSGSLFLRASGEIGRVLVPAHGRLAGARVIELDGAWLGGLLSLGTRL